MATPLAEFIDKLLDQVLGGAMGRAAALDAIRAEAPEVYSGLAALLETLDSQTGASPNAGGNLDTTLNLKDPPTTDRRWIGSYRTVRILGSGGMGVVYHGYRVAPFFRQAAVKLLSTKTLSSESRLRFRWECQALANLQHPNIARVFDAGECDDGIYYAMELLAGEPITDYCDNHRLTLEERLDLFAATCDAVRHAHGRAIVHRDLKPANIMVVQVDGKPSVRIIDFGIAATLGGLSSLDLANQAGLGSAGTPGYGAPEQWQAGAGVDVRQDVYALGVLLRELILGLTPLDDRVLRDGAQLNPVLWRRLDPQRRADIVCRRRSTPARLKALFQSDLCALIQRAAAPDPRDRYETTAALVQDLDRWRAGRLLPWASHSILYRLKHQIRHLSHLPASSLAAIALVVFALSYATYGHMRFKEALAAQLRRSQQQHTSRDDLAFTERFLNDVLNAGSRYRAGDGADFSQILDQVAKNLDEMPPGNEARVLKMRLQLGNALYNLGFFKAALVQHLRAYTGYKMLYEATDGRTLEAMRLYGDSLVNCGELGKAGGVFEDLWHLHEAVTSPGQPRRLRTLLSMTQLKLAMGQFQEAYNLSLSIGGLEAGPAPSEHDLWRAKLLSVKALIGLGRWDQAKVKAEAAWHYHHQHYGAQHRGSGVAVFLLARVLFEQGRYDESVALLEPLTKTRLAQLGPDHVETLEAQELLAMTRYRMGDRRKALDQIEFLINKRKDPDHAPDLFTLSALNNFLTVLVDDGQLDQAVTLAEHIRMGYLQGAHTGHSSYLVAQQNMGELYRVQGRYQEALRQLKAVAWEKEARYGKDFHGTLITQATIAQVYLDCGQPLKAKEILVDLCRRAGSDPDLRALLAHFRMYLAEAMIQLGQDWDLAKGHLENARLELPQDERAQKHIGQLLVRWQSARQEASAPP